VEEELNTGLNGKNAKNINKNNPKDCTVDKSIQFYN